MDALVVKQHIHTTLSPDVLKQVFGVALKKIGSVRMIVALWRNPSSTYHDALLAVRQAG